MGSFKTCWGKISSKINFLNKFSSSWKCPKKSKKFVVSDDSNWLTSSFSSMEVSNQLKQVFRLMDTDGDGKISPLELSEVLLSLGHEKSMATKEAEGMVREMDCNGDGLVDLDEFLNVMMGCSDKNDIGEDEVLEEAFLVFDFDKNGFISAKELQRVLVSLGCKKCGIKDCRRMIKGVDKDGDGFVAFEEFKLMMNAGYRV